MEFIVLLCLESEDDPYSHHRQDTSIFSAADILIIVDTCMIFCVLFFDLGFQGGSVIKNLPANKRDVGLIPGQARSRGEGNGNRLQYSCLGNPMDRGAWWAIVHWVVKESDTTYQLNNNNSNNILSFIKISGSEFYSQTINITKAWVCY